jgi:antitoxin (DNA-binding transcriptional repressor) of toxin-antitoxin stability system
VLSIQEFGDIKEEKRRLTGPLCSHGGPMARLVPLLDQARAKKLGLLRGKLVIPENFNDPLDESTIADLEGR